MLQKHISRMLTNLQLNIDAEICTFHEECIEYDIEQILHRYRYANHG